MLKGLKMMDNFISSSLSTDWNKSFFDPIKRNNLLTFKTKVKIGIGRSSKMAHRIAELVFMRASTLSQYRDDVNMDIIAHYPIGPVPSSLFTEFGLKCKLTKSDLCMKLVKDSI